MAAWWREKHPPNGAKSSRQHGFPYTPYCSARGGHSRSPSEPPPARRRQPCPRSKRTRARTKIDGRTAAVPPNRRGAVGVVGTVASHRSQRRVSRTMAATTLYGVRLRASPSLTFVRSKGYGGRMVSVGRRWLRPFHVKERTGGSMVSVCASFDGEPTVESLTLPAIWTTPENAVEVSLKCPFCAVLCCCVACFPCLIFLLVGIAMAEEEPPPMAG
jgi:hypothetical protein